MERMESPKLRKGDFVMTMRKHLTIPATLAFVLGLVLGAAGGVVAQERGPRPLLQGPGEMRGHLHRSGGLQRALESAGAPALSDAQKEQLASLMQSLSEAFRPGGAEDDLGAAHKAYEDAVLSGDLGTAQAQAAFIATQMAERMNARLQAEADFKIKALEILTQEQVDALIQRFGTRGLFGLLGPGLRAAGPGASRPFGRFGRGPRPGDLPSPR